MTRIIKSSLLLAALFAGFSPLVASFQCKIPQILTSLPINHLQLHMADETADPTTSGTKSATRVETTKNQSGGIVGNWEELHGNWVLRPSSSETPRALIHFLGGALVGASPHIAYRYMLERLADKGFLVVATPYHLSFDHMESCDEIITKFEALAPSIARQYGAVPVVGIGHSLGSLLQLLITCLFPDTPRAANALISFNNPVVTDAVPFFEEVFAPFFTSISSTNGTLPNSNDILKMTLSLAKGATEGQLPSDEQLQKLTSFLPPFQSNSNVKIPKELRSTFEKAVSPSVDALSEAGLLPVLNQVVVGFEQIPKLIEEVSNPKVATGARDFEPTPSAVEVAARKAYRARRTLILGFKDDGLDESDQIEQLLKEAESITRMRRPMVGVNVQRKELEGNHATPLLAPPLDLAGRAEDILGSDASKDRLLYQQTSATVDQLVEWLEEVNL